MGHLLLYLGFTAQAMKVCRTPGPTACYTFEKVLRHHTLYNAAT